MENKEHNDMITQKNQSHILNKNHHTRKITTRSIQLKIRKKNDHKQY